jgi:hypothetical protein|tara:strand:- start:9650 stop:10096 length:447 start_codon:yes stop_codon:yes gene_type:complete
MASSIYIYDSIKEFEHFYKGYLDEPLRKIKINDLFIHKNSKLWVVTNTNDLKERPLLQKSLVHFRNGSVDKYADKDTKLVLYDKMKFNRKKMRLSFFPRFLRKAVLDWRVDRHLSENIPHKNKIIDYDHRYYDYELDRLNFILKPDKS